jgi:hypothetical protein
MQDHGCPTLATFLFLPLGWESTPLNRPYFALTLSSSTPCEGTDTA